MLSIFLILLNVALAALNVVVYVAFDGTRINLFAAVFSGLAALFILAVEVTA